MIKVFNGTDNTFSSNGDVVLNPTRAIVHKEDNGSFYLDLETNLNEEAKIVPSEEGSTITINGSAQIQNVDTTKEVELTQVLGNTTQNGTPTPTSPIPISNVSGLQEVEITNGTTTNTYEINLGKQLFNFDDTHYFRFDNASTLSKTNNVITFANSLDNNRGFVWWNIPVKIGKQISISYSSIIEQTENSANGVCYLESDTPITSYVADINNSTQLDKTSKKATITTTKQYLVLILRARNINSISVSDLIVNYGTPTTYAEYFTPIELNKIGNYKDYIFKGKGVNLFDKSSTPLYNSNNMQYTETDTGCKLTTGTNGSGFVLIDLGDIKQYENKTLTFSMSNTANALYKYIAFVGCNNSGGDRTTIGSALGSSTNTLTTTIGSSYTQTRLTIRLYIEGGSANTNYELNNIMVQEGTQTPYEPYNAKDKWLLHKEIGKVVLNGTPSWRRSGTKTSGNYYFFEDSLLSDVKFDSNNRFIGIANMGITTNTYQEIQGFDTIYHNNTYVRSRFYSDTTKAMSTSEFATWLSSHNIITYYVLANPTTTEITNSELLEDLDSIELLDGLNNIMITSSDLPATLDIHYNYVSGGEVKTSYIDYLVANNILVANTPQGNQAFRITNVDKTRSKIRLQANHIFYDSQNYIIKDSYVVEKNCNEALDHLNNATDSESPFTTLSDVNTIASYRCVRKSLYEAIQVILERWGGHLVRDNFEIKIMDTIGSDNQVVVRYGKNLKNIEAVYDWNAVATKLMPVGADGLLLPEEWLYANNSYEIPYTKVISFDQSNINQEDYADDEAYQQALIDDLRQKGNEYLATNSVPMVNYTLDANLEKISDVGDTIEVIDERLGINLLTHLISFDYNCLLDRYEQLQFGNFTPKLNDLMSTISESTTQAIEENNAVIKATLSDELTRATGRIWDALGSSYIIYDGDKILVLDQLPKESAQNVIMINSGGIGFSNTGIDGTFTSAWTIDNILNMENINVINLTADLIRGGILKLGSNLNQYGQLEIYNEANDLIAEMNKDGFKMYGQDGSYILINNQVGLSGYDRNGTRIYWADGDAFHMKKSEVEEEITLCGKMRYIPIQISSGGSITNDGIGLVSVYGGE